MMDIHLIDWIFVFLYILVVFGIAIKSREDMHESELKSDKEIAQEKYLANKSLTFTESLCSIIGTEVSALTFIGSPALAFKTNFSFVQIYFGALFARIIIALYFLPKVYSQGLTIYEIMAKNFGFPSGQRTVSIFFIMGKMVAVGVRLFTGSILVATFMQVSVPLALMIVTIFTLIYIQIGGLKAVVRTDMFQMSLFILGGLLAHYIIPKTAGMSWGEMMGMAHAAGKTTIVDWSNPWPFVIGIAGGFLFDMCTHGVDQDYVQRLISNRTLKSAQLAIFCSSFLSITIGLLFLSVGGLLWSFYQVNPFPESVPNADHLFPYFIVHYFPLGVKGVMVAGVLAATMSVMDSTLNALCATSYNDIFPNRSREKTEFWGVVDSIFFGAGMLTVALLASKFDGLLLLGLKAQSWTGGSLLALFMSKVLFKKYFYYPLDFWAVLGAYAFGITGVYINLHVLQWDWNFNVYWGFTMGLIFLKLYGIHYEKVRA